MLFRHPGQWKTLAKEAVERTGLVAKFFCLCHVTNTYLFSSVLVYGPSMYPTLNHTGDVVLVERLSTRFRKVEQGDIVVVRSPENPNKTVTKRVPGLEGDRVTFMPDPHHSEDTTTIVVPKGQVWIQGDNVYASRDSRHFGPLPYGLLEGKVFYRVWPIPGFGALEHGFWKWKYLEGLSNSRFL